MSALGVNSVIGNSYCYKNSNRLAVPDINSFKLYELMEEKERQTKSDITPCSNQKAELKIYLNK